MFKKICLFTVILFLTGCTPKIISAKSPLLDIEKNKCFIFPSKEYLISKSIYTQKLYSLTDKVLLEKGINVTYGDNTLCNNYLTTSWNVSEDEYIVTSKGSSYTNTYGTINTNLYNNGYIPVQSNSYTYTSPDTTYKAKDYYGTYLLNIGIKKNNKILKVWEGSMSGLLSSDNIKEAEIVEDDDLPIVKKMITRMIKENKL